MIFKKEQSALPRRPGRLRPKWQKNGAGSLIAAILVALAFMAATRSQPAPARIEIVSEDDTVSVPTPARQVARGEQLSRVEFATVKWPKSKLTGDYLLELETHKDSFAATTLPAHLPIPRSALSKSALDTNAVAEAIPFGMRAITVKVDAESAVEGWARSGNYIDVILVRTAKEAGLESLVIAENVKILSAGASAQPLNSQENAPKAPNTVTLLVSQEDALRIKTAGNIGRLTFALRGNGDAQPTLTTSIDQRKLLGPAPLPKKLPEYIGHATGPDGRTYVLAENSKWFRSSGNNPLSTAGVKDGK